MKPRSSERPIVALGTRCEGRTVNRAAPNVGCHSEPNVPLQRLFGNLITILPDIVAAVLEETLPPEVTVFELAARTAVLGE
jgi:hypothetical protein